MKLIAIRDTYYTRALRAGEVFEARDRHAVTLKALRQADDAPAALAAAPVKPMDTSNSEAIVPVRRGRYGRRDTQAIDQTPEPLIPAGGLDYTRRDMRAEGG